jgi:hypothetical protein
MPDQFEQYYKYLKANGADVAPDFNSFKNTLSDYNNASKYYSYLKENQFDVPATYDSFADTFGLKKKDIGGPISSPTASQSVSKSFISSLPEQKSIYAPSQKLASESTTVVAPKEAKLISEANKRGTQITKEAIENSNNLYLANENKGVYKFTKDSPSIQQNKKSLEEQLSGGALQVVKSPKTGKYVLAHNAGIFNSFSRAWDNVLAKQADDKYVAGLSTEDKIKHYEVKDILNKDKYLEAAPAGFTGSVGRLLGENAEPLIKLAAMGTIGGKAAQAAGATAQTVANAQKFGSFLAFATDAGYSGYANNTERVYKSLRQQDPNGNPVEQMRKAENAGLIGEASGIGMAAGMTGIFKNLKGAAEAINTKPFVSALETMAKHTSKEAAVQGSIASLNSIVSDLGAKSQGMDIGVGDIVDNALESGKTMAQFVGVTGLAMGTLTGLMKVPGYVKAQAKGLVSELPREEVKAVYEGAEANGIIPEGTTNKVINSLNEYDVAKQKIPEGLSSEHKAALTGIQEKIDKLENSKKNLAPQYHNRIDGTINSLKERAIKIMDSKNPMVEEVDNILNTKGSEEIAGPPITEVDLIEEVTPKEVKITEEVKPSEVKVTEEVKQTENKKFNITEENIKGGVESLPYKGLNDADVSDIVDKINNNEKLDFKIDSKEFDNKINYTLYMDNRPFGVLSADKNTGEISDAGVHKALINKGVGYEMYSKVNDIIYKETGKTLKSDSKQISPSAIKLWEKLVKNNKATQVGISKNGRPLFEMNKPNEVKVTEEVKPISLEDEYNSKSVDELIALKKKLYPEPNIETPMTPEEKLLDRVIAKKFSEKNQEIIEKRKAAAKEVKPTKEKPKEEKTFAQKDLDRAEAKRIHSRVAEMEPPSDAEQVALRYLAEGGKVSQDAINEVSGTTKRASLNTGRRELKTAEAKARDYSGGNESLDDLAHRLWENSGQKISERDIKDALMSEIGNNNTRLDASKAYLERYNADYKIEQEEMRIAEQYAEQYLEEQDKLEKELRKPLDEQIEGEASEDHINNLINQYEAELKAENQQLGSEGKGEAGKEAGKGKVAEKVTETELAKDYKETVAKVSKKAKENAKKEFVDRNFDSIVEKLKIQIKCPT